MIIANLSYLGTTEYPMVVSLLLLTAVAFAFLLDQKS